MCSAAVRASGAAQISSWKTSERGENGDSNRRLKDALEPADVNRKTEFQWEDCAHYTPKATAKQNRRATGSGLNTTYKQYRRPLESLLQRGPGRSAPLRSRFCLAERHQTQFHLRGTLIHTRYRLANVFFTLLRLDKSGSNASGLH